MKIRRKFSAVVATGGLIAGLVVGGIVLAAPANADTCSAASVELFTSNAGLCFDNVGDYGVNRSDVKSWCAGNTHTAQIPYSNRLFFGTVYTFPGGGCDHFPGYPAVVYNTVKVLEVTG